MTLTAHRDLAAIRAGLERWLHRPVADLRRPAPGWSCETIIVDDELVVRLPPVADGIFPTYDLAQQAAVQCAAAAASVPVAAPVTYEPDPAYLGAPFLTMPFIAGPIPSEYTPGDRWLRSLAGDEARRRVWESLLETMVAIHRVPFDGLGLRSGLASEVSFWESYVDWACDGSPPAGLVDALAWCREHVPADVAADGLLWGDCRLGNVVFDPTTFRPRAVLDWDMVSAGPFEMDVAWYLALERVQIDLTGQSVGGFGTHAEAVALVEARLGRALVDVPWFEVFALVRSSAVATRIGILFQRAGQPAPFTPGHDPTLLAALARIG